VNGEICELVEDAVACLALEHPVAYAAVQSELGARRVELSVDDECFLVELGPVPLHAPTLAVTTDLETMCALVHGEVTMLDAVLGSRFDVVARPHDLVAAAAAANHFLQGAMRCVSMPRLLERLLTMRKERT
jgi:hypothetical protein